MLEILPPSLAQSFGVLPIILALLALAYTVYGSVWRLYLSPVAKFPGPWFAALTFWNEFYYDVVLGGRYTWKIAEYHDRYGEYPNAVKTGHAKVTLDVQRLSVYIRPNHSNQSVRDTYQGSRIHRRTVCWSQQAEEQQMVVVGMYRRIVAMSQSEFD